MIKNLNKQMLIIKLTVYLFLIALIIFVALSIKNKFFMKEGFNTYFRQTVRPHIRNLKDAFKIVTYHFNTGFRDFRRTLGFY
jgi:hypothetical protein